MALLAVTFRSAELSAGMGFGEAVMLTVGAGNTVTIAEALAVPPDPVAVAVYVVVAEGLTAFVPPEAATRKLLPSLPLTDTELEYVATTVRLDAAPAAIEVGLAPMVTVGAGGGGPVTVTWAVAVAGVVPVAPIAVAV